jgi:hypothetical protein
VALIENLLEKAAGDCLVLFLQRRRKERTRKKQ